MFSRTHWLNDLYKEGKMKKLLAKHGKDINETNIIGHGTQVYCFGRKDERKILKVVPKKIRFFNEESFQSFKEEINKLDPFFIPVIKIIYEDEHVFIYSQHICHRIKDYSSNDPYVVMSILLLIIAMLLKDRIVTDIGPHNIGIYHRNIGIFDCHGLHKINKGTAWYSRLVINLERYVNFFYKKELTTLFSSNDINLIIRTLSRDLFDPLYRDYYTKLSQKKRFIIDNKLQIISKYQ